MKEPMYHVVTTGQPETFSLNYHRCEGAVGPKTHGTMRYLPGTGFEVIMRCYEENPRAVYTEPDDPVFCDSCMEVFLNCFPELPEYGYINVEINANGAMRCRFGTCRQDRRMIREMGLPHPTVTISRDEHSWQIRCMIPESLLEALYQRPCHFPQGHIMRGNFHKCGDETAQPHWTTWSELTRLDFHTPSCFGWLEIV